MIGGHEKENGEPIWAPSWHEQHKLDEGEGLFDVVDDDENNED